MASTITTISLPETGFVRLPNIIGNSAIPEASLVVV